MKRISENPWDFLNEYRGKLFNGEWPTLPELFNITLTRYPNNDFLISFEPEEIKLTYRETADYVEKLAKHFKNRGIKKGDRIGLTGKNSPEWVIAYLAIVSSHAIVVPIDYQLNPEKISHLLDFSGSRLLIVDEEKYDDIKFQGKLSLSPNKPNYILSLTDKIDLTPIKTRRESEEEESETLTEEDTAAILFTSGTTGNEKGVILTHKNFVSDIFLSQSLLNIGPTDVFYALLPLHHSYSMNAVFFQAMSVGASIVFAKRLVTKQILSDLKKGKVTMFLGIPLLFNKLLKGILKGIREKGMVVYGIIRFLMGLSGLIKKLTGINPGKKMFGFILKKVSLDNIRICISGGGPLAPSTFKTYNQLGINFVQGYGLTETAPIITLNPIVGYREKSVGKIIPQVEMKVLNPDSNGIGELIVKGPVVTKGYYNNEEATREAFTEDGYFKTGDLGYIDKDNYVYLSGRKKHMIVTEGGKNVYPEEIEDHFQLYDEVEQVLVRGYLKDKAMKVEGIEALIYPSHDYFEELSRIEGKTITEADIEKRIKEIVFKINGELLPYQRIDRVVILKEPMEMTTTKKIKRHMVRV